MSNYPSKEPGGLGGGAVFLFMVAVGAGVFVFFLALALLSALSGCSRQSVAFNDVVVHWTNYLNWTPTNVVAPPYAADPVPLPPRTNALPPMPGKISGAQVLVTQPRRRGTNFPVLMVSWQDLDPSVAEFVVFGGRKDGAETFSHSVMAPTNSLAIVPFNGPAWLNVEAIGFDGMMAVSTNLYLGINTNWPCAVSTYEENGVQYVGFMATAGFTWFLTRAGSTNWLWSDAPPTNRLEQVALPAQWPAAFRIGRNR